MYDFSLDPVRVPEIETPHRRIKTAIPNPKTLSVLRDGLKYEPISMNDQLPVVWDRAEGYQVYDVSGNCWIDFTSTIFVTNVGHSHPRVVEAMRKTLDQKLLNAYYYVTEIRTQLARKMIEITPSALNKVLFLSTGSEASEVAVKTTMMYGRKIDKAKTIVVGFEGSFHGKTMGSQTLGGKPGGKAWIEHHHPRIVHMPYPYPWTLEKECMTGEEFFHHSLAQLRASGLNLEHIAGFMAEPYQGWCAVFFPVDYMKAMRKWATDHKALIGFDEVQAGFGRTGKMFGFEHYGIEPDIIWCGKAISSSIPVSAVVANEKILDVDASLNSTHGGNPLGMAASLASIQALQDENLVAESARKGELVRREIEAWRKSAPDYVCEAYGTGLVWGIFLRDPETGALAVDLVDKVIEKSMQKGLLSIRTCSGTIKLGPPLMIPDAAISEGFAVMRESLQECT